MSNGATEHVVKLFSQSSSCISCWKNYTATDFQYIASHSSSVGAHAEVNQTAGAIGLSGCKIFE